MRKLNSAEFIGKAIKIHGDRYDYSLVEYKDTHSKVTIKCLIHGIFYQSPANHIRGNGCPRCIGKKETIIDFFKKANLLHEDKYDYSLVSFKSKQEKIKIICPIHGEFQQRCSHHLSGVGCPKCVGKNKTTEDFINESKKVHGDKYDYSLVRYINDKTRVKIICPKHGVFEQMSGKHLQGQGCSHCKESKGEREIRKFLIENNIKFIPQKRFKDCRDKKPLPFDFYLPEYNTCIEYQGRQHFEPISNWGGVDGLKKIQKRDKIKKDYCNRNRIKLICVTQFDLTNLYDQFAPTFLQNYG